MPRRRDNGDPSSIFFLALVPGTKSSSRHPCLWRVSLYTRSVCVETEGDVLFLVLFPFFHAILVLPLFRAGSQSLIRERIDRKSLKEREGKPQIPKSIA